MENFKAQRIETKKRLVDFLRPEMTRQELESIIEESLSDSDLKPKAIKTLFNLTTFASISGTDEEIIQKAKDHDEAVKLFRAKKASYLPAGGAPPKMSLDTIKAIGMFNLSSEEQDSMMSFLLDNGIIEKYPIEGSTDYFIKSSVSEIIKSIFS